ncbi:MAG TPA: hypothetical protein VH520_13500 [Streptosporangiaceae bacterium]|jgi:hypothetical protein
MDVPQVGVQVRKAPTQAIRAVFAGIGKILLAADRPPQGQRPAGPRHAAPGGRAPQAAPAAATAATAATASQRWRSLDETGNVRLLSTEELTVGHGTVVAAATVPSTLADEGQAPAEDATTTPVASQPLTGNVPIGAGFVVHALPLPGYDTLPVASIRARLRSLEVDQLQALLVYEHKNAQRPEIIAMIERRIQKLENGG